MNNLTVEILFPIDPAPAEKESHLLQALSLHGKSIGSCQPSSHCPPQSALSFTGGKAINSLLGGTTSTLLLEAPRLESGH